MLCGAFVGEDRLICRMLLVAEGKWQEEGESDHLIYVFQPSPSGFRR